MHDLAVMSALSEGQFAALVDAMCGDPARRGELTDLLREDHPVFQQRGTATTVRMRGWMLLALARIGLSDATLLFVLEELETGNDPYLVAAAARTLRSYPNPSPAFAPFVIRALVNLRYRDDPVTLESYGGYAASASSTSPVRELLATVAWLGPEARAIVNEVELLRAPYGGLPKRLFPDVDRAVKAIRAGDQGDESGVERCCTLPSGLQSVCSWARTFRRDSAVVEDIIFEDQDGAAISFWELFRGHPSIVVFFYSRCDNPLKCSLTITKLARIQRLLEARGLAGKIHTAAITYDPGFDLPDRLRGYGRSRGLEMNAWNRMVRATKASSALRSHFKLGVNFIESLVNRHRIEAYVLDAEGRIASCFERIHWDESRIVDRAIEVLNEQTHRADSETTLSHTSNATARHFWGALSSLGLALFPKCPACWASYLSMSGVATLEQIPYSPWLQPLFIALMLMNLGAVWIRRHSTMGMIALLLVAAGTFTTIICKFAWVWDKGALLGFALSLVGSITSAVWTSTHEQVLVSKSTFS
jgi:protein SCO1/2